MYRPRPRPPNEPPVLIEKRPGPSPRPQLTLLISAEVSSDLSWRRRRSSESDAKSSSPEEEEDADAGEEDEEAPRRRGFLRPRLTTLARMRRWRSKPVETSGGEADETPEVEGVRRGGLGGGVRRPRPRRRRNRSSEWSLFFRNLSICFVSAEDSDRGTAEAGSACTWLCTAVGLESFRRKVNPAFRTTGSQRRGGDAVGGEETLGENT